MKGKIEDPLVGQRAVARSLGIPEVARKVVDGRVVHERPIEGSNLDALIDAAYAELGRRRAQPMTARSVREMINITRGEFWGWEDVSAILESPAWKAWVGRMVSSLMFD